MWVVALVGCGWRAPHYEPDPPFVAAVSRDRGADVLLEVEARQARPGVAPLRHPGQHPTLREAWAYLNTDRRWVRGAELDLLVPVEGEERWPVTVWIDGGEVRVAEAGAPVQEIPPIPWIIAQPIAAALVDWLYPYELESVDAEWTRSDVAVLLAALAVLSGDERRGLDGLVFGRRAGRPGQRRQAVYDDRGETFRIDLFDAAFEQFGAFVGPLDAPRPYSLLVIVHEIGHAVAAWPLRDAFDSYSSAFDAWHLAPADASFTELEHLHNRTRARWRAFKRLGRRGPVIDAFVAARGPGRGPTPYARRSPHEAFAEAFALYHLDPDALERAMPSVYTWFEAGGHLAWRRGEP